MVTLNNVNLVAKEDSTYKIVTPEKVYYFPINSCAISFKRKYEKR